MTPPIHKLCGKPLDLIEIQRSDDIVYRFDEKLGCYVQNVGSSPVSEIICQHCYTEADQEERAAILALFRSGGIAPACMSQSK